MLYDIFICHASEDKEDFVRPLAELLKQQNIEVWYDEFSLSVGDSLTQKIDEGLTKSRFGIVVLSPNFFKKSWTKRELSGLTSREMFEKRDVILPIWHRVDLSQIIEHSPPLADKMAISSSNGINAVLRQLIQKIKPEPSSLIVARDHLNKVGFDTPSISDEWWLDIIEYQEFLKFPDINMGKRWIFPLPFPWDEHGSKRGLNIASTALQIDWSFEGEELNISPLTPPDEVHAFLRRWPGLFDCARGNPKILALYAPQLTIPGFDHGFEDVFDHLLEIKSEACNEIFSYGQHDTIDGNTALCGDIIALRHPEFGNYTADELAHWYFDGHNGQYKKSSINIFTGLIWLLSTKSNWLPEKYRHLFIEGIMLRDAWQRDLWHSHMGNSFVDAFLENTRKQFKFTKKIRQGLLEIIDAASKELSIKDGSKELADSLINLDIINRYYDYGDKIKAARNKHK